MCWYKGFENIVRDNVPLREYTWYKLGGPARWFCRPESESQIAELVRRLREAEIPWRILGGGANILVPDAGFDGLVIHINGPAFEQIEFDGEYVRAGAGVDFQKLITATIKEDLVGLEAFAGIPGSMGGIIRMNAGGRYGEIREFVHELRLLDFSGRISTVPASEIGFKYRHTDLGERIVIDACLKLNRGDSQAARQRYREIYAEKQSNQPPIAARCAGCIFKNPPEKPAGLLLDRAGLKGTRVGGAEISTRHANFILAYNDATAEDVLNLIALARQRVHDATGIELKTEVEIWQ